MFFSQPKLGKFLTWDSDLQVGSCQWKIMKFFPRNLSLWCKKLSKWSWNLVLYDVFGTINWRVAIGTVPEAKISKSFPRVELHGLDRFFVDIGQPMCCLISKTRLWITFTLYNEAPFITSSNLFYNENRKIYHPRNLAWRCSFFRFFLLFFHFYFSCFFLFILFDSDVFCVLISFFFLSYFIFCVRFFLFVYLVCFF